MEIPSEIFSELTLFVCTYVAKLGNIKISFEKLTHTLCENLFGNIIAINSNYGHMSQKGYEQFLKKPKINSNLYLRNRSRKMQGDGTCFNSAIEPVIKLDSSKEGKYYYIKCFPTTGETQIPGVINEDFSDGHEVLVLFVNYLNSLKVGNDNSIIFIEYEGPKMLNYKFRLNRSSDRILINLISFSKYLQFLEIHKTDENLTYILEDWVMIYPPYTIKEIKSSVDDIKVSFRIQTSEKRSPRINIFQEGKINILGADSIESAREIYKFLTNLFKYNWTKLINIKPEKDKY